MKRKQIFITGADRGIGLELTRHFLQQGEYVYAGKFNNNLTYLDDLKEKYNDKLHIVPLDICSEESVQEAVITIEGYTDHLDVLVNNSAILGDIEKTIFDEIDLEDVQNTINTNTIGTLRVTNRIMPLLVKGDKKLVVNLSSEAGSIAESSRDSWYGYCMSKAAINAQSNMVHNALKKIGGLVIVIHPGWVKTSMRGYLDKDATLTPMEAAKGIARAINTSDRYKTHKVSFIDYAGNSMMW